MRTFDGFPADTIPPQHFLQGQLLSALRAVQRRSTADLSGPGSGGIGVHLTLDLGGQARFGPDVEWIDEIDYDVDHAVPASFYAAVRKYWPGLPDEPDPGLFWHPAQDSGQGSLPPIS